ncbi:MAG: UvrD-helicase domain-containing protein [Endomicrobium sp.]|jgi:DNA helicase-2/ATP-dependent DNA helicase PcrA|nr:UvrD-helicase domain-containing protein [Endomicrobium sp.]
MKNLLIKNLNLFQKEAVFYTKGPLIIFAGAGTGKTKVITHRIAYLLSLDISPRSVLAVTFTNKAATEMKRKVNNLISQIEVKKYMLKDIQISTFHSFCAYFLRIEGSKISLSPNFVIYDFSDQKNIIKDCLKELNVDEKKIKISNVINKISRAKDDLKSPSDMAIESNSVNNFDIATMVEIYNLYQKKLERSNALDFGDLIMHTVIILQQYPTILEKYHEKYKYIMVDEYQDTNHAQYTLIKLLAQKYCNICVVGDDDQSIYSWRGANIGNILNFKKDYPTAKSIKLEQNYRSTPKILESAHKVVKHNSERVNKCLWTQNVDDGSVSIVKALNENDEAAKVADLILSKTFNNKYNFSEFAIFYRTNAQSRTFEDAFRKRGIPYTIVGTLRFYDRAEIKNIMAYLKLIHNPNDNINLKRIINIPRRGIGKTSLQTLERFANLKKISIWQAIIFAQEAGLTRVALNATKAFEQFVKIFIDLKNNISIKEIAERIIIHSEYLKDLGNENTSESKAKIENIQELISAINDFERHSSDKSLAGYLTQTALISDIDFLDESKGKVTLMTLHLAKGLEFHNVFLCGLEEGLFPIGEFAFNFEGLAEERRLMYVGMTRARKHLYLCWAAERTIFGKIKWNVPSRFISEAGFKYEFIEGKYKYNGDDYTYLQSYYEMIKGIQPYKPTENNNPYKMGTMVFHKFFGKGKIIEINGIGNDLKIVVLFETGQCKKLLAKIANLALV